ncbi:hypothetical protein C0995_016263, partial [Termitomyces sp. Mi166
VVQLSKTKPESKGKKGMQRDLLKNKAQAISKGKSKKKEKEQELSATADEQLMILLQQPHDTEVLKEVDAGVLKKPIAQLAFTQVLNGLDTTHQQRDEVHADLFCQALRKGLPLHSLPISLRRLIEQSPCHSR